MVFADMTLRRFLCVGVWPRMKPCPKVDIIGEWYPTWHLIHLALTSKSVKP